MIPTSMSSSKSATPSALRFSFYIHQRLPLAVTDFLYRRATIGNMIRRFPCTDARSKRTQVVYGTLIYLFLDRNTQSTVTPRMGSFLLEGRSKEVLYLHRYPLYEQQQVYRSCLQELLCMLHIGHLQLGILVNPYTRILYGKDQQLLHRIIIYTFNVFRCTDVSCQFKVFTISCYCFSVFKKSPFSFLFSISFTS